jgi:PTS system nitrogen regulatory IIA component
MVTIDLKPHEVILDLPAATLADIIGAAAEALAPECALPAAALRETLLDAVRDTSVAVGSGIAMPHAGVRGLERARVALVRTAPPLSVGALDGAAVDLFFVVLFPSGNPRAHLELLAHLAGMCRSRVFRDGLRSACAVDEVLALVDAAQRRLGTATRTATARESERALALISVTGERAADAILMALLREQLGAATIVDAQTVQDAASREVPLFAGFRDLFGDPGGRRLILAQLAPERADALAAIVQRACEDDGTASAQLSVVPIAQAWAWGPRPERTRAKGH